MYPKEKYPFLELKSIGDEFSSASKLDYRVNILVAALPCQWSDPIVFICKSPDRIREEEDHLKKMISNLTEDEWKSVCRVEMIDFERIDSFRGNPVSFDLVRNRSDLKCREFRVGIERRLTFFEEAVFESLIDLVAFEELNSKFLSQRMLECLNSIPNRKFVVEEVADVLCPRRSAVCGQNSE